MERKMKDQGGEWGKGKRGGGSENFLSKNCLNISPLMGNSVDTKTANAVI